VRIVSLLPSTTEILFALGAGDHVVGVTFECDTPEEARTRHVVSTSAMPHGLSPREVDDFVAKALARGDDLYHLQADALAVLDPDLVVTQDLCAVCAVDVSVVDDALTYLGCRAEVASFDPHTLDEVWSSILDLGRRTGTSSAAADLVAGLQRRLDDVEAAVAGLPSPRVLVLEWTDPPFAPGHWIPEMVLRAGGVPSLGAVGEKSHRVTWEDVAASEPDLVVSAPCGYSLEESVALTEEVLHHLPPVPVWAVDANASYARPGPRLVDGIETLSAVLHPDLVADGASLESAARLR
jgi:iron complex transport system substrate-binding protein